MIKNHRQCRRPRFDPWVGKIPWRRAWQPTPVFLPGESHGQRSLVGYSPWGYKESVTSKHSTVQCVYVYPQFPILSLFTLVKAMVFPVVMYECENWTIEKAERQRIDALELWCWRRLLRAPWTARRSNQSILKEISPDVEAETPIFCPPDAKS